MFFLAISHFGRHFPIFPGKYIFSSVVMVPIEINIHLIRFVMYGGKFGRLEFDAEITHLL
jgi:hypothetical protein